MSALLCLWASYVLSAFLWTGLVVALLGAFTLTIGLCRAASLRDSEADLEAAADRKLAQVQSRRAKPLGGRP